MVALRIPEGVFLTDYKMIWVWGFSHCSSQNCLVILKLLESTVPLLGNLCHVKDLLLFSVYYLELRRNIGSIHYICDTIKKLLFGYSTPALLPWVSEGKRGSLFYNNDVTRNKGHLGYLLCICS